MKPTLKDVAKLAGVNFTLVSKYLNHSSQARMTPEIAGVIHSNTGDMVRELCSMLLNQIENSGAVLGNRIFPTVFRPAGSPEFEALKTRHFQLT